MTRLQLPCVPRPGPILWSVLACLLVSAPAASASVLAQSQAPTIESVSESDIGPRGATLEAQVATGGLETEYRLWVACGAGLFKCGTPELVAGAKIPAATASEAVSAGVEGLNQADRYSYWVTATNADGTSVGPTRVFQPEAWPGPVSQTEAAGDVAAHEATLTGQIGPTAAEAGEFMYFFEYGTTDSYGASAPDAPGATLRVGSCGMICAGEATRPEPVSAVVSGLAPATTYHYRLVTTSSGGYRQFGPDFTFTTAAQISLPSEPSETPASAGAAQASASAPLLASPPSLQGAGRRSSPRSLTPRSGRVRARRPHTR